MFVGHYSAAFAAKALEPSIPLWKLFIAVQLVDYAWALLLLVGIEHVRLIPGFMEASMLDLYFMPYTHSLLATVFWCVVGGVGFALTEKPSIRRNLVVIFALAIGSHWLLDFLVHGPDLALYPGGLKVGLGLWNSLLVSQLIEIGLLVLAAGWLFFKTGVSRRSSIAVFGLVVFAMVAIQLVNAQPVQTVPTVSSFAVTALVAFSVLALMAYVIDRWGLKRAADR